MKTGKRVLAVLLAVVMLATAAPTGFAAESEIIDGGICGKNLTWVLDSDGTLTIGGDGAMYNYSEIWDSSMRTYHTSAPWGKNYLFIKKIVIGDGVNSIGNAAFCICNSAISVTIAESVEFIGEGAFSYCSSLKNVMLPHGVKTIEKDTFRGCSSLINVTIPNGLTSIGDYAFRDCSDLARITIPSTVKKIGFWAFLGSGTLRVDIQDMAAWCEINFLSNYSNPVMHTGYLYCNGYLIEDLIVPNGVTKIASFAFCEYSRLKSVSIPDGVTSIGEAAFRECSNLTSVTISDSVSSIGSYAFFGCSELKTMTIPDGVTSIPQSAFSDCSGLKSVVIGTSVTIIHNWAFDDCTNLSDVYYLGGKEQWEAIIIGSDNNPLRNATIHYNSSNPDEPDNPSSANKLVCDVTHDQDYYYTGEGFYGENAYITDTMELYVSLTNQPGVIGPNGDRENRPIHDVTMTATVNTSKLSFSPDAVKQTYSVSFDTIDIDQTVDDLLLLYPQSGFSGDETKVQVSITLSSPDFDTVQETYTSTCHKIETDPVQKHLSFIRGQNNTTNDDKQNYLNYTVSKRNEFGHALHEMASDPEYMWSRITSLDIDNYFKITFADLMATVLYANQTTLPSVLPSVIREYVKHLKNAQAAIKSVLDQDSLNVSTTFLDKLLKSSKYTENGIYTDNALYQTVINKFSNTNNANTLKNVFAASDKTKQFMKVISWGKNVINDTLDCVNKITLLNAFHEADQSFKNVIQYLYDSIPQSDNKERAAVAEYLNYDASNSSRLLEPLKVLTQTGAKISFETIETVLGKKVLDYLVVKAFAWVGEHLIIHGVAWGTTASYAAVSNAISTGLNPVLAGVSAGLLVSEILCDSSGKAKEMAKGIHMSFYSSYILQTLAHFEGELSKNQDSKASSEFEYAFFLHKAAQSYMVDHMAKSVEVKNSSLMYTVTTVGILDRMFGKSHNIDQTITQLMEIKNQFDNLYCHKEETPVLSNSVTKTKIIKIHCPVDVVVYNSSNNNEVIRIEDDIVKNMVAGVYCVISDGEKYILVPDNGEYQVVITSTGNGTMSYSVIEFSNGEEQIEYGKAGIPLSVGKVFTGTIVEGDATAATDYNLKFDNNTVVMQEIQSEGPDVPHTHTYTATITTAPTCTTPGETTYTCTCGDTYTDPIPALGHIDEDNNGYCDRSGCGEMMTGGDHCPQCGKIHNGGFFDSIVGFFHRLIYRLTHLFG